MRTWVTLLVVVLGGCNHDTLDVPAIEDMAVATEPPDLRPTIDLPPARDLYRQPDLLPRPDLLGPVPPLRFAPPLLQGSAGSGRTGLRDFNNDGRLDVGVVGFRYVSVTLQRPGGWMLPIDTPFHVSSGNDSYEGTFADFDGDGTLDVLVTAWYDDKAQVLFGKGDGSFREGPRQTLSHYLSTLAADDLDGDGKMDLIVTKVWLLGINNGEDQSVRVLRGNGDGTFGPPTIYNSSAGRTIVVADINGDGKRDIAVGNDDGTITLLTGVGNGTFLPPAQYGAGQSATSAASADFDRDGRADLIVGTGDGVRPMMSRNNGLVAGAAIALPQGSRTEVVAGDWNGDGNPDFAVSLNGFGNPVIPFLGDGKGGFLRGVDVTTPTSGPLAAADLGGDGRVDLLVGSQAVHSGDGAGHFGPARALPSGQFPVAVAAADVDEDGLPDIVAMFSLELAVFPAAGGGRYRDGTHTAIAGGTDFALGAIDGDTHLDVVSVPGNRSETISFWPGRGDASWGAPVTSPPPRRQSDSHAPVLGDLDGDGWLDAVVVAPEVALIAVLFGDSGGGFRRGPTFTTTMYPSNVVLGDWNGDQRLDLTIASVPDSKILVFLNQGGGAFADAQTVASGVQSRAVACADFDNDGLLDLSTANFDGTVSVLRGKAGGGFLPHVEFAVGEVPRPRMLAAADLNGDGRPDLVVPTTDKLFVFAGNGDGTLQAPLALPTARFTASLSAVDVDGDGDIDLLTSDGDVPWLTTYINQTK